MTFFLVLLVFVFQRFLGAAHRWHRTPLVPKLLAGFSGWLQAKVKPAKLQFIIFLTVSLGAVFGFVLLLQVALNSLGYFIGAFLVLWYSLNAYQSDWRKKLEQAGTRQVASLFVIAYARVFAIIFWFLIFGPVGAFAYRLLCLLQHDDVLVKAVSPWKKSNGDVRGIIDWLPLRMVGLTYALSGHFVPTFMLWRRQFRLLAAQPNIIGGWGSTALHLSTERSAARPGIAAGELIDRALWVWLVVIALLSFSSLWG